MLHIYFARWIGHDSTFDARAIAVGMLAARDAFKNLAPSRTFSALAAAGMPLVFRIADCIRTTADTEQQLATGNVACGLADYR